MSTIEILRKVIRGMPVEIVTAKTGGIALVFVADEYAGSAERDNTLGTWGAFSLHRTGDPKTSEGMWSAIDDVITEHVMGATRAILSR
jgi:hypothetical protein